MRYFEIEANRTPSESFQMLKTEGYFEGHRAVISKHIDQARSFILVAMAWFTDRSLFDQLLRKANEGVQVHVLIHNDDINNTSGIDYGRMNGKNSELHFIAHGKRTMHHKFCVIDGLTVLHGSYNWTYQAMANYENLTVTQGDIDFAASFTREFFKLKNSQVNKIVPESNSVQEVLPQQPMDRYSRKLRREISKVQGKESLLDKINRALAESKMRKIPPDNPNTTTTP